MAVHTSTSRTFHLRHCIEIEKKEDWVKQICLVAQIPREHVSSIFFSLEMDIYGMIYIRIIAFGEREGGKRAEILFSFVLLRAIRCFRRLSDFLAIDGPPLSESEEEGRVREVERSCDGNIGANQLPIVMGTYTYVQG